LRGRMWGHGRGVVTVDRGDAGLRPPGRPRHHRRGAPARSPSCSAFPAGRASCSKPSFLLTRARSGTTSGQFRSKPVAVRPPPPWAERARRRATVLASATACHRARRHGKPRERSPEARRPSLPHRRGDGRRHGSDLNRPRQGAARPARREDLVPTPSRCVWLGAATSPRLRLRACWRRRPLDPDHRCRRSSPLETFYRVRSSGSPRARTASSHVGSLALRAHARLFQPGTTDTFAWRRRQREILGTPIHFELSVLNVDKPALTASEVRGASTSSPGVPRWS
jgi:hypothetical protein